MGKKAIAALVFAFTIIAVLIVTIIVSFKVVKQTTDKINLALKQDLQKIVRIPQVIPPETKSFDKTTYIWEMETKEGEITKVKFTHDTAFSKKTEKINATLEMEPNSDPSIFNKVLPAVIAEPQTIISIVDPARANLSANGEAGYKKIELLANDASQVVKINWEFNKNVFVEKRSDLYSKIYSFPDPLLVLLYKLQRGILLLFSA